MYSRDAKYYDELNRDIQTEDISFYASTIPDDASSICEVACGTGRILLTLAKEGRRLSGIDASEEMLDIARRKSEDSGIDVDWVLGDMRCLPEMEPVDVMICGYNSMQHLLGESEVLAFFRKARERLADDGIFILDVFNPCDDFLFTGGSRCHVTAFADGDDEVSVVEKTLYHPDTEINDIVYLYYINGEYSFSEGYHMRQYSPEVLDALVEESGLRVISKFGGYDKSGFSEESYKQIFVLGR